MARSDLERIDPVAMLDDLMERLRANVDECPETALVESELEQLREKRGRTWIWETIWRRISMIRRRS